METGNMEHTPGPWTYKQTHPMSGNVWYVIINSTGRGPIMEVGGTDQNGQIAEAKYLVTDPIEIEANARLIAAAPDGLAFAHAALDCLKTLANGTTDEIDTMRRNLRGPASIIQQGQDFINKAQGKENPE